MRDISIGLLGAGTVGTGVVRLLARNAEYIKARLGAQVVVRRVVCADLTKERAEDIDPSLLSDRPADVLDDPEIDVVVELIGGGDEVLGYLRTAIANGKHVVTANKALLAKHGEALMSAAADKGLDLFFEASVGAGIPIIRSLREALASDRIHALYGIINGTTNYILSRMAETGGSFKDMLDEASVLGYAEADPSLDVDGHDAAQKLAILTTMAFGLRVTEDDINTVGIRNITALDIKVAAEWSYVIKLLAVAAETDGMIEARVQPALIPKDNLLSHVNGVYNAVLLHSDASGFQLLYGKGAGMMPTASAVVSDVIELCRNLVQKRHGRTPGFSFQAGSRSHLRILPYEQSRSRYYIHVQAVDQPGVLGQIASILGEHHISIAEMKQLTVTEPQGGVPVLLLTHVAAAGDVSRAVEKIDRLEISTAPCRTLHVVAPEITD